MKTFITSLALVAAAFAAPAFAQDSRPDTGAERTMAAQAPDAPQGIASYGPFRVLDHKRVALVDSTDESSLADFQAMLAAHPGIDTIEMVECPGTDDDVANLNLGRLIRAKGISTHVPSDGSVRSGAVELFLAGKQRLIDDGAEFAVHAWRDSDGHEPDDYGTDSPYNRAYIDYYRDMGLARPQAFYDMTNAVPNSDARWLTAQDMRGWLGEASEGDVTVPAPANEPSIAYLDLGNGFP